LHKIFELLASARMTPGEPPHKRQVLANQSVARAQIAVAVVLAE
jgi:hypothetical protein